ncbi:DNA mismatch repair protein MutS [Buchnera aphidicola]|uniref:DNA mismatch repair protein MutS n=1 Tax=Buchnera aphidicola TaxID=9 RepID=UPI0034646421
MSNKYENNLNLHTPIIRQYLSIKKKYPDFVLFFRMGDFYELFYKDAITVSDILKIVLTNRGYSAGKKVPMAGIPVHTAERYWKKLLNLGKSIAVCEQVKNKLSCKNKLINREVIQVITPGTVVEDFFLNNDVDNILAAVYKNENKFGYSYVDISSGDFYVSEHENLESFLSELYRTNPVELLCSDNFKDINTIKTNNTLIEYRSIAEFELESAYRQLILHFNTQNLEGFGLKKDHLGLGSAGCLLQYIKSVQKILLRNILSIKINVPKKYILLDKVSRIHLELTKNVLGGYKNTLSYVLNRCTTSMGVRMLKRWIHAPIRDIKIIKNRQNSIKELQEKYIELKFIFRKISDLERICSRVVTLKANPIDIIKIKLTLLEFIKIKKVLVKIKGENIKRIVKRLGNNKEIISLLNSSINPDSPMSIKNGNVIAKGYNRKLDHLRNISKNSLSVIQKFETLEKKILKIDSLKVGFNRIIGYYIQINKKYKKLIPEKYIKIQTLKLYNRYTTLELKKFEKEIISSKFKSLELENYLYYKLLEKLNFYIPFLKISAKAIAELDVLSNLAERAVKLKYVCPYLTNKTEIRLNDSRHPVIESILTHSFVPNSVNLSRKNRMLIITGPNMGGKSTYMRQIGLIVIMAWIGSFVPAKTAVIGNIDQIFTRIGSSDDLSGGKSSFMVEMIETANILNNATSNSLVLIDEIGRGTSINDGLALAWSVSLYLVKYIQSITLFSTHYFELTKLEKKNKNIKNVYLSTVEYDGKISFLYKLEQGFINKSYGILVAVLSGFPIKVIDLANAKLKEIKIKKKITFRLFLKKYFNISSLSFIFKKIKGIKKIFFKNF